MTSTHISSTVLPRDHQQLMFTEMEGVDEAQPRSFNGVGDADVGQRSSTGELTSIDQALSKALPGSKSPKHMILSQSMEMSSIATQGLETYRTTDGTNEASPSISEQPLRRFMYPVPRRILCDNCDEWIIIKDADGNDTGDWDEHAATCAYSREPRELSPSVAGDASTSISATPAPTGDSSEPRDTNTEFRRRKVKDYESERFTLLQRDPQIEAVEPFRVFCGFCEKWVQLRTDRPYCPIAWTAHKLRCVNRRRKLGVVPKKMRRGQLADSAMATEVPSPPSVQTRRTEEERIRFLESDPHVTTVEAHRVLCGICRRWIQLRKNSTYCTAPWVQHVQKCAYKHGTPREIHGTSAAYTLGDGEDGGDSEDGALQNQLEYISPPTKRGRGRPKKRKLGETARPSFALRPVGATSPSPLGRHRGSRRSSASPLLSRTPSPPVAHPYSQDMYWYPALPPMSTYYPLYAGSQYDKNDDTYSLYFHAQPLSLRSDQTSSQAPDRPKPSKPMYFNPSGATWTAPGSGGRSSVPGPSGSTLPHLRTGSPGPDGASSKSGRAWIVWRLKDYSSNPCPIDPANAPVTHTSAPSEASGSASGSEPLPMYRSGTWPHLMDPEGPGPQQTLLPYVHRPENGTLPAARPPHSEPIPPQLSAPPIEDPPMITFKSSAHGPIQKNVPYDRQPRVMTFDHNIDPRLSAPPPILNPSVVAFDHNIDPRLSAMPPMLKPPDPPKGSDLDSAECRLAYTFKVIAYLFRTSFQGADDMSLETLMSFMNHNIPPGKMYDGQEVSQHVAILGERKKLVFTREGGVQLLASPPP